MDWNALLSTMMIVVFILVMMRGCGGMMRGGGCGMGVHHPRRRQPDKADSSTGHTGHSKEAR